MPKSKQIIRRPKCSPSADFWYTLKIGIPIGLALLVGLPFLFDWLGG